MSPKSRGRPPGRGRAKKPGRNVPTRPPTPAGFAVSDAGDLLSEPSRLMAEVAASSWLGYAWIDADPRERDPETMLCIDVVRHAQRKPSQATYTAIQALRLVAPPSEHEMLDESAEIFAEVFATPPWATTPRPEPAAAYVATDPWGSAVGLLIEYAGDDPHGLLTHVTYPGGTIVQTIGLVGPGAAQGWNDRLDEDEIPMPIVERPVEEVIGRLAAALRYSASVWPKLDDDGYVDLRALAAARCTAMQSNEDPDDGADWEPISDEERADLLEDFLRESGMPGDHVTRSIADYCISYGDGYIEGGVLAWSPGEVMLFMADWLPRKALLDAEQGAAVPAVTRAWVQFALARAGIEQRWIDPAVAAVDEYADELAEALEDDEAWGPGKQVLTELIERGVDITDPDELEAGIAAYNTEIERRRREG